MEAARAVSADPEKRKALDAAFKEVWDVLNDVREFTASTPEGLAFLLRIGALDLERGCKVSPNLLTSAASVVGLDLETVARARAGFFR